MGRASGNSTGKALEGTKLETVLALHTCSLSPRLSQVFLQVRGSNLGKTCVIVEGHTGQSRLLRSTHRLRLQAENTPSAHFQGCKVSWRCWLIRSLWKSLFLSCTWSWPCCVLPQHEQ